MSIQINIVSSRKKDLAELLEAVAKFVKGSANDRVHAILNVDLKEKEK